MEKPYRCDTEVVRRGECEAEPVPFVQWISRGDTTLRADFYETDSSTRIPCCCCFVVVSCCCSCCMDFMFWGLFFFCVCCVPLAIGLPCADCRSSHSRKPPNVSSRQRHADCVAATVATLSHFLFLIFCVWIQDSRLLLRSLCTPSTVVCLVKLMVLPLRWLRAREAFFFSWIYLAIRQM